MGTAMVTGAFSGIGLEPARLLAGKPVAIVGIQNRLLAGSIRFTPRSVVRRVVRYLQEPR